MALKLTEGDDLDFSFETFLFFKKSFVQIYGKCILLNYDLDQFGKLYLCKQNWNIVFLPTLSC